VIGWPVAHSRSPVMMAAALEALGMSWRYMRLPVPPELFAETVLGLPGSGYRGANVTIPHKPAALRVATRATAAASAIGAANTLTFEPDGAIEADNTDAGGFLDALGEPPRGLSALVLGAGGAGRAVAWALHEAGAAQVMLWNRTAERAAALATELQVDYVERPRQADLIVNATSVGLRDGEERAAIAALGLDSLEPPAVAVDMVYGSEGTPFARWAARGGARVVCGLDILVAQGARSLERWTGRPAPLDIMRTAVAI